MDKYIQDPEVIRDGDMKTYKMVWIRSLVEIRVLELLKNIEIYQRVVEEIDVIDPSMDTNHNGFLGLRVESIYPKHQPCFGERCLLEISKGWEYYLRPLRTREERTVTPHEPEKIRDHSHILFDLINYRWTSEFNHSPRISKKVRGTDREDIKRKSLSKFKSIWILKPKSHLF